MSDRAIYTDAIASKKVAWWWVGGGSTHYRPYLRVKFLSLTFDFDPDPDPELDKKDLYHNEMEICSYSYLRDGLIYLMKQ